MRVVKHTHAIILRRHEEDTDSDKFSIFKTTSGVLEAKDEVDKIIGLPEDIYYVCDLAAVSDITNNFNFVYVIGYNCATPRIVSRKWSGQAIGLELSLPQVWEGNLVSVADMAWAAGYFGIPKDVLFPAVFECLELAIKGIALDDIKTKQAHQNIVDYKSGNIDAKCLKELTGEFDKYIADIGYVSINYALLHCSLLALGKHMSSNAYDAMVNIADVLYDRGEGELIAILRSHIPLRKLLIASLGA